MPYPSWNDRYASGEPLPWDSGTPDPMLIEMVESRAIAPGRTLDVGCGTGTNAIYLADHGFEVMGSTSRLSPSSRRVPGRMGAAVSRRSIS
jgi:2-polyprenyl-3-methyl-5-hydroxy-6-metoxy-1,4-benzoquinol methylase